jgi:hypothetical protein
VSSASQTSLKLYSQPLSPLYFKQLTAMDLEAKQRGEADVLHDQRRKEADETIIVKWWQEVSYHVLDYIGVM